MAHKKPIRVFYSPISRRFFATQHYKVEPRGDGTARFEITGVKHDVTDDLAYALTNHDIKADELNVVESEAQR